MDEWEMFAQGDYDLDQMVAFEQFNLMTRSLYAPTMQTPPGVVRFFFWTEKDMVSFETDYDGYQTARDNIVAHGLGNQMSFNGVVQLCYDTWQALRKSYVHTEKTAALLAAREFSLGVLTADKNKWRGLHRVSVFCADLPNSQIKTVVVENPRTFPLQVVTLQ